MSTYLNRTQGGESRSTDQGSGVNACRTKGGGWALPGAGELCKKAGALGP